MDPKVKVLKIATMIGFKEFIDYKGLPQSLWLFQWPCLWPLGLTIHMVGNGLGVALVRKHGHNMLEGI